MDSKIICEMLFGIIGGLGIFLLGMKNMSEGMQEVAGEKLRKLIGAVTNNRFIACGVGTAVTSVVQSSSVTTVTVVGMVNAGIMTLTQAIGVILGANIGTTVTAWILVIKIGKYGLPMLGVSAIIYLFSKKDRLRYTAAVFLGLGMVFFGLELMKNGFAPLRTMPGFEDWFHRFSPDTYLGVLKCVSVGAILTAVVQSSSATIGITMGLAFNGVIDYPTAAALVLGENIGTTITAFLASLGASTNAKRASYAHIMFNVIGVLWITAIFMGYTKLVQTFVGWQTGHNVSEAVVNAEQTTYPYMMEAIAITHTVFNVLNTIMFLPFVGYMAAFLNKFVKGKAVAEEPRLTALDIRLLDAPVLGIRQSSQEILRMATVAAEMMDGLKEILSSNLAENSSSRKEELFKKERQLDVIQKEITEFVGSMLTGNISHELSEQCTGQLRIADEYESISDYIINILKLNLKLADVGQTVTDEGKKEMLDLHNQTAEYLVMINKAVADENENILLEAQNKGKLITALMKKYRSEHIARVESGKATPIKSLIYTDILNAYRRIKDHGLNIAEVLAGEK